MRTASAFVACALAGLSAGCATAHQMAAPAELRTCGLVSDPRQVSRLEKLFTDGEISDLLDVDVRAKLPSAVAVARLRSHCYGFQPYLDHIAAEEIAAWQKAVEGQTQILGVMPVTRLVHAGEHVTMHSLRQAAARMSCELLLVYLQSDTTVDNFNDAAALYWTVAGLWLVPGNVYEHRTVMQAVLLDCRTGMILGTASGDNRGKRVYPAAFKNIQRDTLARTTPPKAMEDLQKGFARLVPCVVRAATAGARQAGAS